MADGVDEAERNDAPPRERSAGAELRRLRATAGAPAEEMKDVLRLALSDRNASTRREAFDFLSERFPGAPEFEAAVLEAAWKDPGPDVRAAAVLAARFYPGEAALAATLDALKAPAARREATRCLRVSSRPGLARRLLGELEASLDARDPDWTCAVLRALSLSRDLEIARKAAALVDTHGSDAAELVAASDDPALLRQLADRARSRDPGVRRRAVVAAFKLGPDEAYARLAPLVLGPERPSSEMIAQAREILSEARRWPDRRWPRLATEVVEARAGLRTGERVKELLGGAELPRGYPIEHLLSALAGFAYAPALPSLWQILQAGRLETYGLVSTIAQIGGPKAFLPLLEASLPWLDAALANLFERLADGPARIAETRGLAEGRPGHAALRHLLSRLERRFSAS